jgi:DNA invertase Pin-like site-specific DNA recombinase
LGLAAQQSKVADFLDSGDEVIAEFVEVQSGKDDQRNELWKAIGHAKKHGAKLLIAKLDRFSRKVSFIASIMEQGIGLVVAEMPHATDFQLHIFAALAQEERRLISDRTRAALAEAKKRGVRLGRHAEVLADKHRKEAVDRAITLEPIIRPLLSEGRSLSAIARHLNAIGVEGPRGGKFHAETIRSIVARLRTR